MARIWEREEDESGGKTSAKFCESCETSPRIAGTKVSNYMEFCLAQLEVPCIIHSWRPPCLSPSSILSPSLSLVRPRRWMRSCRFFVRRKTQRPPRRRGASRAYGSWILMKSRARDGGSFAFPLALSFLLSLFYPPAPLSALLAFAATSFSPACSVYRPPRKWRAHCIAAKTRSGLPGQPAARYRDIFRLRDIWIQIGITKGIIIYYSYRFVPLQNGS